MSQSRFIVADALAALGQLDAGSVDLVVTSPPFLALRSYLPAEHPHKVHEIGGEATPGAFIDALLDVTEALARVLAPHGSLCVELGDSYAGSSSVGSDDRGSSRYPQGRTGYASRRAAPSRHKYAGPWANPGFGDSFKGGNPGGDGWPMDKSLCMVPELYRLALVYGRNALTGRTTDPWRVRNVVRWHRPNPPVGQLSDKFRPSTSDVVVACKSAKRYFDLDAVRTASQGQGDCYTNGPKSKQREDEGIDGAGRYAARIDSNPAGAPPLDTWVIPTAPYQGRHYATFPPALVTRPVLSMCPHRVCRTCGEPSRRITQPTEDYAARPYAGQGIRRGRRRRREPHRPE